MALEKSGSPLSFSYSPDEIESLCAKKQDEFRRALDIIGKTPADKISFKTTVQALEQSSTSFGNAINPVLFLKYVSPDAKVRAAADRCETSVQQMFVDIFAREDLFRAIKSFKDSQPTLTREDQQLLDEYLSNFKRNGLELSGDQRTIFIEKKKKLVVIESEFSKHLVEWEDSLDVTEEELDGLPETYVQSLSRTSEGRYRITLDYPHYYPFMENAKSAAARRKLEFKFNNRGGETNRKLLEEAIGLRDELAHMLGYANHAAFVLEKRMAKTPETVKRFLARLGDKLKEKGAGDLGQMLEAKRTDLRDPNIQELNTWDWRYYGNILKKTKYSVDTQKVKEYFPLDVVIGGMFDIFQTLFGVKLVRDQNAPVWHESVQLFRVVQNDETLSYFYMDLFPREGKYGHAAAFTLTNGFETETGGYVKPVSSIVANFNPPGESRPSLLEHSEVETLFHEFGHILHQVLTRAKHATFSGTSVKTDYVEAPSQMLENWVWETASLEKLSGHYQDRSKHLPPELVAQMQKAKYLNSGLKYLRQVAFSTIDLTYHTSSHVDSTAVYKRLMIEIMLIPVQEGTEPQASFGHLMGGYDAGYYGYLWSEVYAQDMFTRFEKEGMLNPKTGADYRKWILEPGGQREPSELISGFLGREPNEEAFLRKLGV